MTITWELALLHAALIPLYLWLGIVRHEVSHAIVYQLQGLGVRDLVMWPHWYRWAWDPTENEWDYLYTFWPIRKSYIDEGFMFGRAIAERWTDRPKDIRSKRLRSLAPYIVNLIAAGLGFWLVPLAFEYGNDYWIIATIVLLWASPVFDTAWNLYAWLVHKRGDWEEAFPHG